MKINLNRKIKDLILLTLLLALFGMVGKAGAAGVIPEMDLITSYSSTGGTPQFKDNEQDLTYKAMQGDVINFSITPTSTSETINYLWQVRQGSQVLASSTEGTTFNWTVPSATSTWQIEIEVTIKDEMGNTTGRESVSWSITTSNLKTVNPGQSIQAAIDSIPSEGGIVELTSGRHILSIGTTLNITKPNFILKGQGKTVTLIDGSGGNNLKIRIGTEPPNLTQPESDFLSNITISDFYINGSSGSSDMGIRLFNVRNYNISNMEITAVYYGVVGTVVASGNISYNYLHNIIGTAILGNQMKTTNISSNNFDTIDLGVQFNRQSAWGNLDFAGSYNIIDNNTFYACTSNSGCIFLYSTATDTTVKNNLINHARLNGITIYGGGRHKIYDNKIYDVYGSGTEGLIAIRPDTINNDIYRNILEGPSDSECISIKYHIPPGGAYKSPSNINIINNVLSGCAGGFSDSYNSTGIFKNNIVVNNSGYGINLSLSKFAVSYNDVWNNTLGNYNGVSAGTGDVSIDPLFANPSAGDFYLKSQTGRWTPSGWVLDSVTSPAIDAGDPLDDYSLEPLPNGNRINIGAYGNTPEASKSPGGSSIDINLDGTVDISDLRIVALHFGEITTSPYPRYDVNTDGTIDILDLRQVAGGM